MSKILSYRGKLANLGQERILLSTKKGEKGYRITKLQLIGASPGAETLEAVVKIYKDEQTSVDGAVDFSENRLLGAGFYVSSQTEEWTSHNILIFDQEIFNQDIYVTHFDASGSNKPANYYMELEVIMLNETEATVATLKDIRNNQ